MAKHHNHHKRFYHFLAPKFWPTWLGLGFLRLIACLPHPLLRALAHPIAWLLRQALKKRVHITRVNLRLCFPEKSPPEREQLLIENFRYAAMGLFELAIAWWSSDRRIRRLVKVNNLAAVQQIQKTQGIVGITAHFTPLELFIRRMALDLPVCAFYREQKNPLFEWYSSNRRLRYVQSVVEREDLRGFLRALKEKQVIGYLPDHDYGLKHSVFAPFFGVQAATLIALPSLLKRKPAPLVSGFIHYLQSKKHYQINCKIIKPGIYPSGDHNQDALFMNQLIENAVRQHPEQYLWQHRRFKNRPHGEDYPY